MPLLDQYSTIDTVRRAYWDSTDYDLSTGSTTKAEQYIRACRILIGLAKRAKKNGEEFEFDPERLAEQEQGALSWLSANATASATTGPGSVRFMDLSTFRD